jgi:DNA-binding transcriptional ArsR family regulator
MKPRSASVGAKRGLNETLVRASSAYGTILLLPSAKAVGATVDAFERLLWWLFAGSVGGSTRARVVYAIKEEPRNAQQLSERLGLDYTTVKHHLKVLAQNHIVLTEGNPYGKLYFLSDSMESHWGKLEEILERSRRRGVK